VIIAKGTTAFRNFWRAHNIQKRFAHVRFDAIFRRSLSADLGELLGSLYGFNIRQISPWLVWPAHSHPFIPFYFPLPQQALPGCPVVKTMSVIGNVSGTYGALFLGGFFASMYVPFFGRRMGKKLRNAQPKWSGCAAGSGLL
jgi:hypothetical protein